MPTLPKRATKIAQRYLQPQYSTTKMCTTMLVFNLAAPRWVMVECNDPISDGFICAKWVNDALKNQHNSIDNMKIECKTGQIIIGSVCYLVHYKRKGLFSRNMSEECKKTDGVVANLGNSKHHYFTFEKWSKYQLIPDDYVDIDKNDEAFCILHIQTETEWWKHYTWDKKRMPCNQTEGIYLCEMDTLVMDDNSLCHHHKEFQCNDQSCISHIYFCDGINDCPFGEDESDYKCICVTKRTENFPLCIKACEGNTCDCTPLYFKCDDGACLLYLSLCDGVHDCSNGEDELCSEIIGFSIVSDDQPQQLLENNNFKCPNSDVSIPISKVGDLIPDCPGSPSPDEKEYEQLKSNPLLYKTCNDSTHLSCVPGHSNCFSRHKLCVYDMDESGSLKYCRNGKHLANCNSYSCNNMFKCPDSYCINYKQVCNGVKDCPFGTDENHCKNQTCPRLMRCRGGLCIHRTEVCDGIKQCINGDDEFLCDIAKCHSQCTCIGLAVTCEGVAYLSNVSFDKDMLVKYLNIKRGLYSISSLEMKLFHGLVFLNISSNFLIKVCSFHLSEHVFQSLYATKVVDISSNHIHKVSEFCFCGMSMLEVLLLKGNEISSIERGAFYGLQNLHTLDLTSNKISYLSGDYFYGIISSLYLHLENNDIKTIESNTFSEISILHLGSPNYKVCCLYKKHKIICPVKRDWMSSCDDLMANRGMRIIIWIMATMSLLFNMICFMIKASKQKRGPNDLIILSLCMSDYMYGLYLLLLAVSDLAYRGNFIGHEETWLESIYCKGAGFVSLFSMLCSAYILSVMTFCRFMATVFPLQTTFSKRTKPVLFLILAGVSINLLLILGVSFSYFFWEGQQKMLNPSCLLYDVGFRSSTLWVATILFITVQLSSFVLIAILYSIILVSLKKAQSRMAECKTNKKRSTQSPLSFHVLVVVVTNATCWIPSCVTYTLALSGYPVGTAVITWVAIVVMPINSAVNPCLFTFATREFNLFLKRFRYKGQSQCVIKSRDRH